MTLRQLHEHAILSGEEITTVRQALAGCSRLLTRAQLDAGNSITRPWKPCGCARRTRSSGA